MARPKKSHSEPAPDNLDPVKLQTAELAAGELGAMQANYGQGRDLVNQMLGQIQMSRAISKFADVVSLSKLKQIKENKLYRAVSGQKGVSPSGEEIADVGTFDGFCSALGLSRSKVDEDLANLNTFGEDALNQLSSIGLGYRDLRQFRKLPADQRTALIEAAKEGDKETLLELAEDMIAKHSREKEALAQQCDEAHAALDEANKDKTAKDAVIAKLKVQGEKRKLNPPTPDQHAAALLAVVHEAEANASAWIDGHLRQAIEALVEHDAESGSDHRSAISGMIAQIEDATDRLRSNFGIARLEQTGVDGFAPLTDDELASIEAAMPKADASPSSLQH